MWEKLISAFAGRVRTTEWRYDVDMFDAPRHALETKSASAAVGLGTCLEGSTPDREKC